MKTHSEFQPAKFPPCVCGEGETNRSSKPASCGVLVEFNGKYLIGHSTNCGYSYGIPKGLKSEGESERAAAVRELFEETSIQMMEEDLGETPWTIYETSRKRIVVFKAKPIHAAPELRCLSVTKGGFPEIDEFHWVTVEEGLVFVRSNHMRAIFEKLKEEAARC